MALTQCPECTGDLPDAARSCPHCGYRLARRFGAAEFFVILVVIAIPLIFAAYWYFGPAAQARREREIAACSAAYNNIQACLMLEYGWNEGDAMHAELEESARREQAR